MMKSISEINTNVPEGRLLIAALSMFASATNVMPDESFIKAEKLAKEIYQDDPPILPQPFGPGEVVTKPFTGPDTFQNRLNQYEAILGFVAYLTTKTEGITLASGHNPGNVDQVIVDFCIANKFPKPKAGWEKLVSFPK